MLEAADRLLSHLYMRLATHHESKDVLIAGLQSLACTVFRGPGTMEEFSESFSYQRTLVERWSRISSLVVLDAAAIGKPERSKRDYAAEQTKLLEKHMVCSATVLLGDKLQATVMRTLVGAMGLMSGMGSRLKVFKTVEEAIVWIRDFPGQDPELVKVLSTFDVKQLSSSSSKAA